MGFPEPLIATTLVDTGGNWDVVASMLLGEPAHPQAPVSGDDAGHDDASSGGGGGETPIDFSHPAVRAILAHPEIQSSLANPRVTEAMQQLMANPALVADFIRDPEIGPVIEHIQRIVDSL
jgi:hypothetical protein